MCLVKYVAFLDTHSGGGGEALAAERRSAAAAPAADAAFDPYGPVLRRLDYGDVPLDPEADTVVAH